MTEKTFTIPPMPEGFTDPDTVRVEIDSIIAEARIDAGEIASPFADIRRIEADIDTDLRMNATEEVFA